MMQSPTDHPVNIRSSNSHLSNSLNNSDFYIQPSCQICEDKTATRHDLRLPRNHISPAVCLSCLGAYGKHLHQAGPGSDEAQNTLLARGSRRFRAWMESANELVHGNDASGIAGSRREIQAEHQREQRIRADLAFWNDSAKILAATARETNTEQMRGRRSFASLGRQDESEGCMSETTLE